MAKTPILSVDLATLVAWCVARGEPAYRAKQILRWIFERRAIEFDDMTDLPRALREQLNAEFSVLGSTLDTTHNTAGETRKLLLRFADQEAVECVLMAEGKRRTVCVSTQ